jgi:hypothetical protein
MGGCASGDSFVGDIRNSFSDGGEIRWRLGPAHRQAERKCHQRLFAGKLGGDDAELGDVVGPDLDSVESVSEIDFDKVDGAELGVGVDDLAEDALQGATKLHGLSGR